MRKLFTTLAAICGFAVSASAAQACDWHKNVTASATPNAESASMSTYDGPIVPTAQEPAKPAEAATPPTCTGEKDCAPGTK